MGGTREPCGDTLKRGHRSAAQPLLSGPHSSHLVSTQQIQTGTQKRSKGHSELQLRRSSRALENAPVSGRTLTRPYDALRGVKCRFTPASVELARHGALRAFSPAAGSGFRTVPAAGPSRCSCCCASRGMKTSQMRLQAGPLGGFGGTRMLRHTGDCLQRSLKWGPESPKGIPKVPRTQAQVTGHTENRKVPTQTGKGSQHMLTARRHRHSFSNKGFKAAIM